MYLSGFADEAANDIDGQIQAIATLGWKNIECRAINGTNLTLIDDATFEMVCERLADAGISVNCFGSGIANWAKKLSDPPESSYEELRRAIPRMHRLGTSLIRIMSFSTPQDSASNDPAIEKEVMSRMRRLVDLAEDGGVTLVHENCDGWGGFSWEHTLKMVDVMNSSRFKLVFDTGNPIFHLDLRGKEPFVQQDAWEYYSKVKEQVIHIHIKDAALVNDKLVYTMPGEGLASIPRILDDLHKRGYDGGFSIEPHLAVVAHDASVTSEASIRLDNFVAYGRRTEKLLRDAGYVV